MDLVSFSFEAGRSNIWSSSVFLYQRQIVEPNEIELKPFYKYKNTVGGFSIYKSSSGMERREIILHLTSRKMFSLLPLPTLLADSHM